jgi:hypothetical protein
MGKNDQFTYKKYYKISVSVIQSMLKMPLSMKIAFAAVSHLADRLT